MAAPGPEAFQRGPDVGPADAVDGDAGVALEVLEGPFGVGTEDAVQPARIEPEGVEPPLECEHVVAADQRLAEVQEAVAELVPGLDQGVPAQLIATTGGQ